MLQKITKVYRTTIMKHFFSVALAALLACQSAFCGDVRPMDVSLRTEVRPSATPLVTVDPYFSLWSFSDRLNESCTVHWTGKESPLLSYVRVDGVTYRLLGTEEPRYLTLLNTIKDGPWEARCIMDETPAGDWTSSDYDDSSWRLVQGAIGSRDRTDAKTFWGGNGSDVWVRREMIVDKPLRTSDEIVLEYSHDDVFELYINGLKVVDTGLRWRDDQILELGAEARAALKPGKNIIAAHCHNTTGGSYVDFGLKVRIPSKTAVTEAEQTSLSVLPTRTVGSFRCGPVDLDLVFTAPLFLEDLELVSRPVNYVTWQARSNDGRNHSVQVYFAASPKQAVHATSQAIEATSGSRDGISYARAGTKEQKILGRKGDNVRIDWGYVYIASPSGKGVVSLDDYYKSVGSFVKSGKTSRGLEAAERDNAVSDILALSYSCNLGKVGSAPVCDYVMLGYDDIFSIQYFGDNLRPYWNRKGDRTIFDQFNAAASEYASLTKRCEDFDRTMLEDARRSGGKEYAELCALAYRQTMAAHKLVEAPNGDLLYFSKENFSNGSIGTVDITYPSAPVFLYYNPVLAQALMNHIFHYSESGRWKKPFAAHDVGSYPWANGQTYGGDMPVEECGNMLIITAAVAKAEGNADYAAKHWAVLTQWADYLVKNGLDPVNQLCTDDFAGHFAHNANLSIKAILGIASYAKMAETLGYREKSAEYMSKAREMASKWEKMANDGDHYRLTFDKPGTWSQKYNLVWDRMLDLNVFDPGIAKTEINWYLKSQNEYGLPLDSRKTYTKTDWVLWTATMADSKEDFRALVEPIWRFQSETVDRVPMSDWIFTDSRHHRGFRARSVVGGYFIKLLSDKFSQSHLQTR